MAEVDFRHVDIVFGSNPAAALKLLDQGEERAAILERTGHVIGVADATIAIEEGKICVLMGLSGSGKSTLLRCVNGLNKATRGEVLVDDPNGPVDVARCDPATLRRLQLLAEKSRTLIFLFRPASVVRESSPAPLRIGIAAANPANGCGRLSLRLFKRRGGALDAPLELDIARPAPLPHAVAGTPPSAAAARSLPAAAVA